MWHSDPVPGKHLVSHILDPSHHSLLYQSFFTTQVLMFTCCSFVLSLEDPYLFLKAIELCFQALNGAGQVDLFLILTFKLVCQLDYLAICGHLVYLQLTDMLFKSAHRLSQIQHDSFNFPHTRLLLEFLNPDILQLDFALHLSQGLTELRGKIPDCIFYLRL